MFPVAFFTPSGKELWDFIIVLGLSYTCCELELATAQWSTPDAQFVGQTSHRVFMRQLLWTVHSLGWCTGITHVTEWESWEPGWYFCTRFIDPQSWGFNHPCIVLNSDSNPYLFFRALCNLELHCIRFCVLFVCIYITIKWINRLEKKWMGKDQVWSESMHASRQGVPNS